MDTWKRSFRALMVAEFLAITGFATSNPIIPLYLGSLGVSGYALDWWTGAVATGASLALAVFAPIWGSLADSYGRKLMLLRAMTGGAILLGLLALTTAPWQVLALRTLQGCVTGTVAAATVLAASIVPEKEAGYRLGLLQVSVFLGNFAGPLFGGLVADFAGSRVNFLATSLLLVAAAVLVARFVNEDFSPRPGRGSVLRNAVPDFAVIRQTSGLAGILAAVFVIQAAGAVNGPRLPIIVARLGAAGEHLGSISGLVIGSGSAAMALGALLTGRISARLGYGRALLLCVLGAFAFYLPQAFAASPWSLLALRVGSGFFIGGAMPSLNALIATMADRSRQGAAYGMSASVSSGGQAVGPMIGSLVATTAGDAAAFLTTGAMLGLTGAGIARVIGRRRAAAAIAPAPVPVEVAP